MLGQDLRLRRFSPSAQKVLNLRPGDIGRHISDFKPKINVPDLVPFIHDVLDKLQIDEREVTDEERRWYTMTIRPYRTADNKIDGAIVSLIDIYALKRKETQIAAARDFARRIIENLREGLLVLNERLRVRYVNHAFCELFQVEPEETEGQLIYAVAKGLWNTASFRSLLDEVISTNDVIRDYRVEYELPAVGRKIMLVNAQRFPTIEGDAETTFIQLSMEDVTERLALEKQVLEISAHEQQRIGQDLHDTASQALSGLSFLARDLTTGLKEKGLPEAESAARITEELERATGQVRQISKGLIAVEVDSHGLMAALDDLVHRVTELSKVNCTFVCATPVLLDDNQTATQLFLIAQEAVANAVKHGQPAHVKVTLSHDRDLLRLEIRDDGSGLGETPTDSGMGLKIMKYRAGLLGADLTIGSARNGGTTVVCHWKRPRPPSAGVIR